jgi:hypothetical protein
LDSDDEEEAGGPARDANEWHMDVSIGFDCGDVTIEVRKLEWQILI